VCVFFPGGRHGGSKDPLEEERESEEKVEMFTRKVSWSAPETGKVCQKNPLKSKIENANSIFI